MDIAVAYTNRAYGRTSSSKACGSPEQTRSISCASLESGIGCVTRVRNVRRGWLLFPVRANGSTGLPYQPVAAGKSTPSLSTYTAARLVSEDQLGSRTPDNKFEPSRERFRFQIWIYEPQLSILFYARLSTRFNDLRKVTQRNPTSRGTPTRGFRNRNTVENRLKPFARNAIELSS
jgi:hypothetical protein